MNIQNNSIIDSIIEYANVKFGMELDPEKVSEQMKLLHFSDILELSNAINNEDDDTFSRIVDLSALNEGYGSSGSVRPSSATIRSQGTTSINSNRRNDNISLKNSRYNGARTVAGSNKQPTGKGASRAGQGVDPDDAQRHDNAQIANGAADNARSNSQEIQRLHDLISKMK